VIGFTYSPLEGDGPRPDGCAIVAFAVLRVPQDDFPALRKRPGPDVGKSLSSGLLRQSDEQSVAGVAAVFHAINDFNLQDLSFADWGVVGAPCLLGRMASAAVLDKFRRLGPRGVSPLVSPYLSLHAVSAMISVGLQAHGPNLGVGGGPGAVAEGLLAGLTLLLEPSTPGVWLVLTGWDPEPDAADSGAAPAVCHAVALALVPAADDWTGLRLRYVASVRGPGVSAPNVTSLARFFDGCSNLGQPGRWSCSIKGGGELELAVEAGSLVSRLQRAGGPL
jgi:hypothetical protein